MNEFYWYPFLGWGVFFISFIVGIILFVRTKKLNPVFYMISIALYIFTAGFYLDVYNLSKGGILLVLVVSACLFMLLGWYFSKIFHSDEMGK